MATSPRTVARPDDHVTIAIPRSALTVVEAPVLVSQRTAERLLGLSPGVYLALVRQYAEAGGEVISEGKARLVEPGAFVGWLRRRSAEQRPAAAAAPTERDGLLSTLGLRLAG